MIRISSAFGRAVSCAALALLTFSMTGRTSAEEIGNGVPLALNAKPAKPGIIEGIRLKLHHLHTGESIDVAYKQGDHYNAAGIGMLNHFLRDHRTSDTADYDPREFDLLHALLAKLGKPNATIDIVCGYRTPMSNNFLRTRSAMTGVAEHSQHMLSKAIDIRIPGVSTLQLRNAALSLGMGGVGYYPTSQFVHVDVGPVRQWQFGGAPANQVASRGSRGRRRSHRA